MGQRCAEGYSDSYAVRINKIYIIFIHRFSSILIMLFTYVLYLLSGVLTLFISLIPTMVLIEVNSRNVSNAKTSIFCGFGFGPCGFGLWWWRSFSSVVNMLRCVCCLLLAFLTYFCPCRCAVPVLLTLNMIEQFWTLAPLSSQARVCVQGSNWSDRVSSFCLRSIFFFSFFATIKPLTSLRSFLFILVFSPEQQAACLLVVLRFRLLWEMFSSLICFSVTDGHCGSTVHRKWVNKWIKLFWARCWYLSAKKSAVW